MLSPTRFRFLNEEHELGNASDWNSPEHPKLWTYNLHYFDDLNAENAEARRGWHETLLTRWVAENLPGKGNGWEPYPVSRRIVNWIKWDFAGGVLSESLQHSLAVQSRWLERRIEWHLLGNHLFSNAKALVFAGLYFHGAEAERWLERGFRILARELPEQVLADGGHFERSTMYHALAVEDLLDLINVTATYHGAVPERWRALVATWPEVASRMRKWLMTMCHPDGEISFFNDAALGIAPEFKSLNDYAAALDMPLDTEGLTRLVALTATGYARLESGPAVLLADIGEIGPSYLPGHAHADTLSFELSVQGRRVFVNGGTSTYTAGAERLRQRGTAAHNTVIVDGQNSSEVWGSFRVARRARPLDVRCGEKLDSLWLEAGHDGYRRLIGCVTHRRRWVLSGNALEILDALEGQSQRAMACFHLHPDFEVVSETNGLKITNGDGLALNFSASQGMPQLIPSTWHSQFGESTASTTIQLPLLGSETRISITWC